MRLLRITTNKIIYIVTITASVQVFYENLKMARLPNIYPGIAFPRVRSSLFVYHNLSIQYGLAWLAFILFSCSPKWEPWLSFWWFSLEWSPQRWNSSAQATQYSSLYVKGLVYLNCSPSLILKEQCNGMFLPSFHRNNFAYSFSIFRSCSFILNVVKIGNDCSYILGFY